jgi:hypothetical protein
MTGNLEDAHFVMGKLVIEFYSFGAFLVSIIPKTGESSLFSALHFDLDVGSLEWLQRFDEDFTVHNVSGLVKGKFSLNLNPALREVASSVTKVEHLIINPGFIQP